MAVAGGQLVLCGPGMYVNRAIAAGIDTPVREADIGLIVGPAMLWATDASGRPITGNDAVHQFLGIPAGGSDLGQALFEIMHDDDFEHLKADLAALQVGPPAGGE